jgi:hypothetical protein
MKFFADFKVPKESAIGITSLLSNITTRDGSHKGGWARLLKCQLTNLGYKDVTILDNSHALHNFNVIIFDLGAEYSGALNLFGGLDEKVFKRLNELQNFSGPLFSWRHELPDVLALDGRRNNKSSCEAFKATASTFLPNVAIKLSKCQVFEHTYKTDKVLIGDSHTPSVWTPEYMIERQDGRTLFGALKSGTIERVVAELTSVKNVMIHMSNIDVRHHLCRQEHPDMATVDLACELGNQLVAVRDQFGLKQIVVCHTIGIEDESRELPKTGYYRGTPFYGSWEQRNRIRSIYNSMMDEFATIGFEVIKYPTNFFDESGKFKFEVMEKPQSVHLSPEYYRWNLDQNIQRW